MNANSKAMPLKAPKQNDVIFLVIKNDKVIRVFDHPVRSGLYAKNVGAHGIMEVQVLSVYRCSMDDKET